MPPYEERYSAGSLVRVAPISELERFKQAWHHHHPLDDSQLRFADAVARVKDVSFYHGGDTLYVLEDVPGTWHEQCLRPHSR